MKIDDALQTILHFFNDIIGAVIPGIVFASGIILMHTGIPSNSDIKNCTSNGALIVLVLALSFAVGHGLLAVFNDIFECILKYCRLLKGKEHFRQYDESNQSYVLFQKLITNKIDQHTLLKLNDNNTKLSFIDLRNIALTVSKDAGDIGRRFMFINLFCNGIGTATLLIAIEFAACEIFWPNALVQYPNSPPTVLQLSMLALFGILCFRRGEEFYKRAMNTPFSIAVAELLMKDAKNEQIVS